MFKILKMKIAFILILLAVLITIVFGPISSGGPLQWFGFFLAFASIILAGNRATARLGFILSGLTANESADVMDDLANPELVDLPQDKE